MKSLFLSFFRKDNPPLFVPIATKLIGGFLLVIGAVGAIFMLAGVQLISNRIISEAQEKVTHDLYAAREIYLSRLDKINDLVRFTADRFFLKDALVSGNIQQAADELLRVKQREMLDVLAITDKDGYVLLRPDNYYVNGDFQGDDELISAVIQHMKPVASTAIVSRQNLEKESRILAEQARVRIIDTPLARPIAETEVTAGMMLKAAAPIFDSQNQLIGVIYGGVLLDKNYEIVDKIKQTVYQDLEFKGKDIGTATIFQDDVRITTNVIRQDGSRAIGTRVSEDVYEQVVLNGQPWLGRAYVVNNWYITAYEPIRDLQNHIIGILYVGLLEEKYLDIRQQTIITFLGITLAGLLASFAVSYYIARKILVPVKKMVTASTAIAHGDLTAQVEIQTNDELQYLADSFNAMAVALKKRDEQLKEYATRKVMESEKLALIGQLSANIAHELNNPLQGIVAYSHLILEKTPCDDPKKESLEKIVGQANRCRDIIRGLLDFSRHRKPDKALCNVNAIMRDCISLVENQAIFHNIHIIEDFRDDLPLIVADHSQIERVFMNMIINAAEAMNDGGQLHLKTQRAQDDNKYVELIFSDTGVGIKKENMEKIFDPFFTTKDVGHGTGLGLAISYGIVKSHKGIILVDSEPNVGTTFTVRFPITANHEGADNGKAG